MLFYTLTTVGKSEPYKVQSISTHIIDYSFDKYIYSYTILTH